MKIANRVFKTPFLQTKTKRSSFGQFYGGNNWKSLGLWSPVLSGVLFDTDKKPYGKEIKKIQVNKANPNGHVAMRWWSILSLAVQFPLKSNDLLWPYFLDLYLIQYFFHTHTSFNWSGFFSILHLIYISCFIMSPELRRGELNLQLIFNYFQNQWHPILVPFIQIYW